MGAPPADGQQLRRDLFRRQRVKFRAEHGLGQGGGNAVQQHRAAGVHPGQGVGEAGAALDGCKAPALPVRNVAADPLNVLIVAGRHGGPVVHGPAFRQTAAQPLGRGAFSAFAAADQ